MFRAVAGDPHILQAPAFAASFLTTGDDIPDSVGIVSVYFNGKPLAFRSLTAHTVAVSPLIALEGDRVELVCRVPAESGMEPRKGPQATYPLTRDEYGFQRPVSPASRGL